MPYSIRKVRNKDCFRVRNKKTRRISAFCTTMEKAKKQIRWLHAIEHSPNLKKTRGKKIVRVK